MPELEPKIDQITVSQPLSDAILTSGRNLNGKALDTAHLILAILAEEGLGKRSMEVVSRGVVSLSNITNTLRKSEESSENPTYIHINGQDVKITSKLAYLLQEANMQAKGSLFVDTGHILQAEVARIDSALGKILNSQPSEKPVAEVLKEYIKIARTQQKYPQEVRSGYPVRMSESATSSSQITDLVSIAKETDSKTVFVNPEWTLALIQSVTSNRLTVIMSDHDEEVSMAIHGMATEVARHGYKDISKIIVPDSSSLIDDPDGIIAQAVKEAKGGVLVLPDDSKYLTHKAVRLALEKRDIRVITYSEEKAWSKSKGLLGQVNPHELYLSSPNQETILRVLQAQKDVLEALYNKNSDSKSKISISTAGLKDASRLGYRYASVMDTSSIIATKKLLETAATNLKLTNSGMDSLLPFKIKKDSVIDSEDVYLALKTLTGIEIQPEDTERLLQIESELKKKIIGQDEAVEIVSRTIKRSETALKDPKRPRGVFMFLGPSGVGKTELAKALNDFLFHDDQAFIQLNMSEYMEQHAVSKLIGAPPGYVGYEEGGQLTEAVRKHPYSIVVQDEVEKANIKVFDLDLQIFEEGKLTDGKGRTVDFRDTIIILTGNVGSEYFDDMEQRGFEAVKKDVLRESQRTFRPEFLNRIDNIIVFKPLSKEAIAKIVDLQIQELNKRLSDNGIKIELTPETHTFLETVGYDPKYGARPLKRAVNNYIADGLTTELLSKKFKAGDTVVASYVDGKISFKIKGK